MSETNSPKVEDIVKLVLDEINNQTIKTVVSPQPPVEEQPVFQ